MITALLKLCSCINIYLSEALSSIQVKYRAKQAEEPYSTMQSSIEVDRSAVLIQNRSYLHLISLVLVFMFAYILAVDHY